MSTADVLRERFGSLFAHSHDAVTTALVVAFALVLGALAAWVGADLVWRPVTFVVAALVVGVALYGRRSRRGVVAVGCYALAALVAAIPIVYELTLALVVADPFTHLVSTTDLLFVVLFWVVAAIPALVGYRVVTGPFVPRVRRRLRSEP